MPDSQYGTYGELKARLDEIVEAVDDDELPLDDALALYEEAVKLGLAASDLIEQDIALRSVGDADGDGEAGGSDSGSAAGDEGSEPRDSVQA